MKPIYKSLELAAMTLQVSVSLQAQVTDGENINETPIPAEVLDSLRVELIDPNVSGARDLIKSGDCTVSDNELAISLNTGDWLKGGVYHLQVSATFGTQTQVIYALDVTVPRYETLASEPQEYEDTVTVVSTYGDGDKSGADASVYAKDGDGNAHVTTPLVVSGGVQEGNPYGEVGEIEVVVLTPEQKAEVEAATGTAYDYCDVNDTINYGGNVTIYADEECTQKVGSIAKVEYSSEPIDGDFFNMQDGESITAGTYYARIERGESGTNSHAEGSGTTASGQSSHAEGNGTTASGDYSHAEGNTTTASGTNSHAEGEGTTASGQSSHAEGDGTTASGHYSHAEGYGTIASQAYQHVCGRLNVEDTDNSFLFIVGNGTNDTHRKNAFVVTNSGELALFEADGTPVILDATTLKALIASVANA